MRGWQLGLKECVANGRRIRASHAFVASSVLLRLIFFLSVEQLRDLRYHEVSEAVGSLNSWRPKGLVAYRLTNRGDLWHAEPITSGSRILSCQATSTL